MSEVAKSDLRVLLLALRRDAAAFFQTIAVDIDPEKDNYWSARRDPEYYWRKISPETLSAARGLTDRMVRNTAQLAASARGSPLLGSEDLTDLREATKSMRSALRLRHYRFHDVEVLNDEDRVLGVRPAHQTESESLSPKEAAATFDTYMSRVLEILALVDASSDLSPASSESTPTNEATRYRPATAFIMMWMDPTRPELADVVDTIKSVFREFGISAVRADDIEHEGQITQRVLNELRTSEFLFADLTGARPNVYYEVGYAHALGRRVVLYRQAGTGLHFDLAGYNCPEYSNQRDLRDKLKRRLENLTNRTARGNDSDA